MKKEGAVKWFGRLKGYSFDKSDTSWDDVFIQDSANDRQNGSNLDQAKEKADRSRAEKSIK